LPPTDSEAKLACLLRLGSHYWTPDFTPAQAKHLLADYIEDLESAFLPDLDAACAYWRRKPDAKRFPKIGELLAIVSDRRRERMDTEKSSPSTFQFGESRPVMWWCLPPNIWKRHWHESEIPADQWDRYAFIKEKRSAEVAQ